VKKVDWGKEDKIRWEGEFELNEKDVSGVF